ncbi:aflatoxin-detoxifizyme [Meredithblackwellia eburnea MCA 4105]
MADRFLADLEPPVCSLNIKTAFDALTDQEKLYSHHLGNACWAGARIISRQTSPVSESIFDLIIATFSAKDSAKLADVEALQKKSGVSEEEWKGVLAYAAQILSNLGNFKSFGATKFVPRVPESAFEAVVKASERSSIAVPLWDSIKDEIYALEPEGLLSIGKPSEGHLSAYYPSNPAPTDAEIDEVQALCDKAGVSTLNTRLAKVDDKTLTLLIASSSSTLPSTYPASLESKSLGFTVHLKAGDFSDALAKVNESLLLAADYAGDSNRKAMILDYERSFKTGDIEAHIDGSKKWVKDQGPVVESYIGFIESYVDPSGARAEWEGFVAIVNKEQSKKFNTLVDAAPELIKTLPWGPDFEVGKFQRPDFTALEILSFATGGIPAGINIPNYHLVREHDGFKNVSLSNILSAKAANEEITFIGPEEVKDFDAWSDKAFEVQVANHELLGHGTGKIFQESADGSVNFDKSLVNPLTGKPIDSWYKPGETYGSRIGPVSSSMEECRAEAVALYLASNQDILDIFKYTGKDAEDLIYYTFLVMVRAGVRALEWYDPKTGKHGQAHMEARLGITNWLITHGLASIEEIRESGELVNAYARVDRKAVLEKGKEVMGKLLLEIQVRKSIGDGKGATAFYKKLTTPNEEWIKELRPLVLKKKLPRKVFVQPNTVLVDGKVNLKEYDVSLIGVIESFIERGL